MNVHDILVKYRVSMHKPWDKKQLITLVKRHKPWDKEQLIIFKSDLHSNLDPVYYFLCAYLQYVK